MNLFLREGKLCYDVSSWEIVNITAMLEYRGDKHNMLKIDSCEWEISANGDKAISRVPQGTFTLRFMKASEGVRFSVSFETSAAFVERKCYRLYVNGFLPVRAQSFIYNATQVAGRVRDLEMGSRSYGSGAIANQWVEGSQYVAFKGKKSGKENYYGFVGFVTFEEYFSEVMLCENGEFFAYANLEERIVSPCEKIQTDVCFVSVQEGNVDILSDYGKRIALENGVNEKCKLPTGWCSWYYYGPDIFQECILENMEYVKKENLPIDYIQIDDGWQKCYGDWEPNERFSMGMKELADKIKENGYTPGIWVAPFLFSADSQTFHNNPDFFIRNPNGEFHPNRLIDYSVEEARQWLYDLARKLSVEWGYRYIKIDLISYRLAISGYKKKGFNAIKNFREAIKIMRSAVTPDTVFLTCTAPLGASAGIADCVRISDDIFERWESLCAVAKQVFRRYFINEYINTDPDCLMVRTEDKHDNETFRICVRDEREIKTFVNFMSASGGAVMLSDKFSLLDEADFTKIRTLFPINNKPAIPLDLFEREIPSVLYYGNRCGVDVYAIFNWSNTDDTITVPVEGKKYIRTYYGKNKDCVVDSFSLTLAPHDSEIVYVSNDKEKLDKVKESIL
jgi:alpha-galactosidase